MAKLTKKEIHIVEMYVRYFGTVATEKQIESFDGVKSLSKITADIRKDADNSKIGLTPTEFLNDVFQNLFGRDANPKDLKYVKTIENNKNLPIATIIKNGSRDDKAVYNTKKLVAQMVATEGRSYELDNINQDNYKSIYNAKKGLLVSTVDDLEAKISNVPDIINGKTDMLTTGVDTLVGTAKNDMFLATSSSTQWTVADSIDGGKGVDTLKLIDNAAITLALPVAATVKNVEILDLISGGAVIADSTSFDGVTDLYTTSKTSAAGVNTKVTAAATTNINVNSTNAAAAGIETVVVDGGKDVTVVSKNNALDTITVGGTTAAAGTVTTVINDGYVDADATATATTTLGNTTINGGTKINASSKVEFTAAQITAAKTIASANQDIVAQGIVTVNGNASTTEVTVSQTAAQAAAGTGGAGATDGRIAITAGNVTINDVNKLDNTKAGTIETVTVKNAAAVIVDSDALKTLNLEGTIASVTATSTSTKATVDTLALNLNGVTIAAAGLATIDTDVKTLNVNSSTTASTLNSLVAAGAKTINISGDAALTVTTLTATATNKVITVTNTAGVTITNALDTDVTFTGGAGKDSVTLTTGYTKAINMGAGDDTVVYAVAGAGGSLNGGDGNDTLVVSADSAIAGLPEVSGFEVLKVKGTSAAGGTTHNAHTFKALEVGTNTVNTTFTNVAAGVGLTVLEANTGITTKVTLANATGTADVFDLTLKSATLINAGTVDLAGVETVNINVADAATAGSAAVIHILDLVATSATKVVVSGNNGLNLTNVGNTKITTFDASGVVANDTATTTDTAVNLKVTFASANNTIGEVVTIIGGAGNDKLTGTLNANDTIIGGAGDDELVYTGGADTFTGGAGNDTFVINYEGTKTKYLTITDLTKGDIIDVTGMLADAAKGLVDGTVGAKTTLGAAATFDEYLNEAAKADGATTNAAAEWFQFEGNTYLVIDNTAGATFTEGTDAVIKITGLVDLNNATTTAATDIITIA